jgi:tetratricopeptide (TPR) repeat protein
MTLHLADLWDFDRPELSEERFRAALATASADEALILQTQIARTYGLRGSFAQAQEILAGIQPLVQTAGPEARVRYHLELGRTHASATHAPETQTDEARELARAAYLRAFELARAASLDALAIDALHMLAFVDPAPEDQLAWNNRALGLVEASSQPDAKSWEGALRNNSGYALHQLGRYEEALQQFQLALAVRQRDGKPGPVRIAYWMIAWTLRAMGRLEEALEIQLQLESECDQAGEPDPYVYEELEHLYRAMGDDARADDYHARLSTARG